MQMVSVAGAMIPAMSAWLALHKRIAFEAGKQVLILGATGNAGRMAIQIAKRLGASLVIAAGRDASMLEQLRALGADTVVSLAGDPAEAAAQVGEAASEVDVVIDYLWGQPAKQYHARACRCSGRNAVARSIGFTSVRWRG